jgi:hypothetical protein
VPLSEPLLDLALPFDQPIHGIVKLVLVGAGNTEIVGERRVGPGADHAELACLRRDDPSNNHRHDEVARAGCLGVDQLVEAEPRHRCANRFDVTVLARGDAFEAIADGAKFLALQHTPDRLNLLDRQRRQIGQSALGDALSLAHTLTQQIGRPRVPVRDRVDVHDIRKHGSPTNGMSHRAALHDYIRLSYGTQTTT